MKSSIIATMLLVAVAAQRPYYAGNSPKGRPELASRFKDTAESTTVRLVNRIADGGTTARIPVDARGDGELVDRLSQWPREHQPFWLLNADHIEAQRNQPAQQPGGVQTRFGDATIPARPDQARSSFLGPVN